VIKKRLEREGGGRERGVPETGDSRVENTKEKGFRSKKTGRGSLGKTKPTTQEGVKNPSADHQVKRKCPSRGGSRNGQKKKKKKVKKGSCQKKKKPPSVRASSDSSIFHLQMFYFTFRRCE